MLKMIKGAIIPNPGLLEECYELNDKKDYKSILMNINSEKTKKYSKNL